MTDNSKIVKLRPAFQCVVCESRNGEERQETIRFDYAEVGGETVQLSATVPVRICHDCGERVLGPEADQVKHEQVCRYLGVLSPDEIRALRGRLQLSRDEMSELTGIGSASIARWELGRMIQSRANDRYLRLLEVSGVRQKLDQLAGHTETFESSPRLQCLEPSDDDFERAKKFRIN